MSLDFNQNVDILIFDADDTLWENNIYYVRATDALFDLAQAAGYSRPEVEEQFYMCEHAMVARMGYGSAVFVKILRKFYDEFSCFSNSDLVITRFEQIVREFESRWDIKPVLFPGVEESLAILKGNYLSYILTKGNHKEQLKKIRMSGLLDYFEDYFIEPEKNKAILERIIKEKKWEPGRICMIGNSPKSDINPALKLGLHAIFIPYAHTWKLDNEDVLTGHPNLHTVERFAELPRLLIS